MNKKIISLMTVILVLISMPVSYAVTQSENVTRIYSNYSEKTSNSTNTQNSSHTNSSTGYKVIIEDDADLLTQKEEVQLKSQMMELTEYGNIVFKSITKNYYNSTSSYASNYYHQMFGTQSGTLFLIDMDERIIYIFSDGNNYKTITKARAETITDNIYTYATNKQYYECAKEAFLQIHTLLEGGKIAEPMKYISNMLIAIMIALFANFVIFKTATGNKATKSGELLNECERYFEHTPPEVTETGTHQVYSPIEHSSGGGGGFSSGGWRRKQRRRRRPQILEDKKKKFWETFMRFGRSPGHLMTHPKNSNF